MLQARRQTGTLGRIDMGDHPFSLIPGIRDRWESHYPPADTGPANSATLSFERSTRR